jgi:hypothetical protein
MTILCRTCHTHVETPCKYTHNCKDFKKRTDDERQARIDEQNRIYKIGEESRKKALNESRCIYISEIPDNLKDKYVNVKTILRFVKGKTYKCTNNYWNILSTLKNIFKNTLYPKQIGTYLK